MSRINIFTIQKEIMEHLLSPEMKTDTAYFKKHGFSSVKNLITTERVEKLREINENIKNYSAFDSFKRNTYNVGIDDENVRALVQSDMFAKFIATLGYGDSIFTDEIVFETDTTSVGFDWHIGVTSFKYIYPEDSAFSIWSPLDPVDPEGQDGGMTLLSTRRGVMFGRRYIDVETGKPVDAYFPDDSSAGRSCLAVKYGVIVDEEFSLEAELDMPISSVEDGYLRLHLLSRRLVEPNKLCLDGLFDVLPNIAWTWAGPIFPTQVDKMRSKVAIEHHHLVVYSLDKFPRMLDYVVPSEVRIGDGDRVRLGAHLAEGTTVIHEGFVNFNAGSLGRCMIKGRVTPGHHFFYKKQ